jgi:hypothetical protein
MQVTHKINNPRVGISVMAKPHFWWDDRDFLSVFMNSEIDFVIWFTPYKHCEMYDQEGKPAVMPTVTIIDTKQSIDAFKYNSNLMESVEL